MEGIAASIGCYRRYLWARGRRLQWLWQAWQFPGCWVECSQGWTRLGDRACVVLVFERGVCVTVCTSHLC